VDQVCPVRGEAVLSTSLEGRLRRSQLCPAGRQLGREVRKLRLQMQTQLFDGVFKPVVGCNLFCLANLDALQIGQDYVGKHPSEGNKRVFHKEILR